MYIKYTMDAFYTPVLNLVPESLEISDNSSAFLTKLRIINETLELSEATTSSITLSRFLLEQGTITEVTSRNLDIFRFLEEPITIIDSSIAFIILPKNNIDTVTITDSASILIYDSVGKAIESVTIVDSASRSVKATRFISEDVVISESNIGFVVIPTYIPNLETVSIVDSGSYNIFQPVLISNAEELSIVDTSITLFSKFPLALDTVEISELSSTYVNTLGVGSIAKSQHSTMTLLDNMVEDTYHYKLGFSKPGEILYSYYNPEIISNKIGLAITTSFTYTETVIIPPYNTYEGFMLPVEYTYTAQYNSVLAHNKRQNIHQIKTDPEGAELVFGIIKEDTLMDFTIISGEPYDIVVEEILIPAFMGVVLVGLEVGDTLVAGQTLEFQVLAYSDVGRQEIDDFLTIHFVGLQKVQIFITLTRVAVFDIFITPDRGSYQESLSYYTVFFESINNARKSKVMMEQPKWSVKYSWTVFQTKKHRAFLNMFREGMNAPILHPLWGHSYILDYSDINTYSVYAYWEDMDLAEGDTIFVFKSADNYRLAKIILLTASGEFPGRIVLNKKFDIEPGYVICPSFVALVEGTVDTSYTGERFMQGSLKANQFDLEV